MGRGREKGEGTGEARKGERETEKEFNPYTVTGSSGNQAGRVSQNPAQHLQLAYLQWPACAWCIGTSSQKHR